MIRSVFVVFFLQNCLCIKFSFLKPTFKKSKNLLVICGSPRHSVWLIPRWVALYLLPYLLSHDRLQEWRALSKARGGFLIFDRCGGCMEFFPPEEKIRFSGNGRIVLSGPCFQSPLLRAGSASCDRGGRTALSGPVVPVTCQELQTLQQHPGWKREEAEARAAHWGLTNTSHAGDQEQNK